jgi:hypothetical protein
MMTWAIAGFRGKLGLDPLDSFEYVLHIRLFVKWVGQIVNPRAGLGRQIHDTSLYHRGARRTITRPIVMFLQGSGGPTIY